MACGRAQDNVLELEEIFYEHLRYLHICGGNCVAYGSLR
jgi:hypothetical protein